MLDKKTRSCLNSEIPGTGLRGGGGRHGPGLPNWKEKILLEPGRDGGDMRKDRKEPIRDVMQEDQQPTE